MINLCRLVYGNRAAAQFMARARGMPDVPAMEEAFAQGELFEWAREQQRRIGEAA
jgi:hypothetical protein